MNWIDIAILGIIGFSALLSIFRGFVNEALSLLSWVSAFFVASQFYYYITDYFTYFSDEFIRNAAAIIVLFIATLIVCGMVRYIVCEIVQRIGLSSIDRILGVCFGIIRGVLIVSAVLFCCDTFTSFSENPVWKSSILIPHFEYLIHWFFDIFQNTTSFLTQ